MRTVSRKTLRSINSVQVNTVLTQHPEIIQWSAADILNLPNVDAETKVMLIVNNLLIDDCVMHSLAYHYVKCLSDSLNISDPVLLNAIDVFKRWNEGECDDESLCDAHYSVLEDVAGIDDFENQDTDIKAVYLATRYATENDINKARIALALAKAILMLRGADQAKENEFQLKYIEQHLKK